MKFYFNALKNYFFEFCYEVYCPSCMDYKMHIYLSSSLCEDGKAIKINLRCKSCLIINSIKLKEKDDEKEKE